MITNEMIKGATYLLLRSSPIVDQKQYEALANEIDEMQIEVDKETDLMEAEKKKEEEADDSK